MLLVLLISTVALSGEANHKALEWNPLYKVDGIQLYVSKRSSPSYFMARGEIEADFFHLLAIFVDLSRRTEWVKNLKKVEHIEGKLDENPVLYSQYHMPWPVKDRDVVIRSEIVKDYQTPSVTLSFKSGPHPRYPERGNHIRIAFTEGRISFSKSSENKVYINYMMSTDPGGWIPGWVNDLFIKTVPLKTIEALKEQLKNTVGLYDRFIEEQRKKYMEAR